MPMANIDLQEVKKFSDIAEDWWNKNGDFKPLHVINPLRTKFIKERTELKNKNVLDVGCGGGLLSESLFDFGAKVTGIDAAGPGIEVAKIHAKETSQKKISINDEKIISWLIIASLFLSSSLINFIFYSMPHVIVASLTVIGVAFSFAIIELTRLINNRLT